MTVLSGELRAPHVGPRCWGGLQANVSAARVGCQKCFGRGLWLWPTAAPADTPFPRLPSLAPPDDLRVVKEFAVKGARECCFSRGGQYFAAVNGNAVHVWDAYTCASVAVLRGHNGKVRYSVPWMGRQGAGRQRSGGRLGESRQAGAAQPPEWLQVSSHCIPCLSSSSSCTNALCRCAACGGPAMTPPSSRPASTALCTSGACWRGVEHATLCKRGGPTPAW